MIVETIPWHQIYSPCRRVRLAVVEDQIHSEDPNVPDQQVAYPPSESGAELSRVEHWLPLVKQCGFPGFGSTLSAEIKHQNAREVYQCKKKLDNFDHPIRKTVRVAEQVSSIKW